jgi:hypothetical protein
LSACEARTITDEEVKVRVILGREVLNPSQRFTPTIGVGNFFTIGKEEIPEK